MVVEWGPSSEHFNGAGALDLLIRYRCGAFPSTGTFYLMIYNDPYQSQLHEVRMNALSFSVFDFEDVSTFRALYIRSARHKIVCLLLFEFLYLQTQFPFLCK